MATKRKSTKKKSAAKVSVFGRWRPNNRILLLLVVLMFAAIGAKLVFFSSAAGSFTYLATHPQASLQATVWGKTLQTLKVWNGKIYAGYGDWNSNTGPINITPYDPVTKTFSAAPELSNDLTESIDKFRIINGNLYAPSIDPRAGYSTDYAFTGFANGSANWQQVGPSHTLSGVRMEHAFDIVSLTGTDLWLVGSEYGTRSAAAFRSFDNGATWAKMLTIPPGLSTNYTRFYAAGVLNGRLYVQATEHDGTTNQVAKQEPNSHVFDGVAWSSGPNLITGNYMYHPENFASKLVYLGKPAPAVQGASQLTSFDGVKAQIVNSPAYFYNYTVDGGYLYAVGANGIIYRTADLSSWQQVAIAPAGAFSVTVYNNIAYVGTSDSKLYAYDLANTTTGSDTTTSPTEPAKKCRGKKC